MLKHGRNGSLPDKKQNLYACHDPVPAMQNDAYKVQLGS